MGEIRIREKREFAHRNMQDAPTFGNFNSPDKEMAPCEAIFPF
jgi:hypothetical protein